MRLTEEQKSFLKQIIDHFDQEDTAVRERQLRTWRRLKLVWEGFQKTWYSEVAHDWRIYDEQLTTGSNNDQGFYDKPVNIFKAYLESIIAALSITVPPIKCYPDDADNPLDLSTARAGDKIGELIYKHNDVSLLWLHALYIFCTEGLVACYSYAKEDKAYGTYDKNKTEDVTTPRKFCPSCNALLDEELFGAPTIDQFDPEGNVSPTPCPECSSELDPNLESQPFTITRIVGKTTKAKSRICLEAFGGLYVKIPVSAMKQSDIPYLIFSYETHYTNVLERYSEELKDKIVNGVGGLSSAGGNEEYERWARLNPQYRGDTPINTVTVRNCWLRPTAFNTIRDDAQVKELKKLFPDGVKVVMVNDLFAEAVPESLDDHWTLTKNPMSDYLHHEPLGLGLVPVQEITNDLISLVLSTIEHGIPQTFADPRVLNFTQYGQSEVNPGTVYPATSQSGKSVADGFYEIKTATLSPEILPFFNKMQELGQLVSGAVPSLFGGNLEGSNTASEYSMSRAQALQRLQNNWKMFTIWWKQIFSKAIPLYIEESQSDEKIVEKDSTGNFVNVFIRQAELQGKIGQVELEANENLPISWQQKKDVIMQLIELNNPEILGVLSSPDNIQFLRDAIGLTDLNVPGEDDRIKQHIELKQLASTDPIMVPPDMEALKEQALMGMLPSPDMLQPKEMPSVEIEPLVDNHNIHAEVCRTFLISEAGRLLKIEKYMSYKNILLHMKEHMDILAGLMMPPSAGQDPNNPEGQENQEKPNGSASPLMTQESPNVSS